jgi:uncharacterized membrane protein
MAKLVMHLKRLVRSEWFWLVLTSAGLRLPTLGREALWYDETFTAWLSSRLDWSQFWQAISGDVHPPLWYLLEALVVRTLGTSEFALRLPSAVFSIIGTLMLWRLARSIGFAQRTAFVAGLLSAVLPAGIYYGQEARVYALLSVFVLLSVQAAIQRRWIWFAIGCIGTVYCHNLGVFYVAALGMAVLWHERRRPLRAIAPAIALISVVGAWSPWAGVMFRQAQAIGAAFWMHPLTVGGALEPLASMTIGWRIPEPLMMHAYAAAFGATLIGVIASRHWLRTRQGTLILVTAFGAPLMVAMASAAWRSVYLPRAFLPSALLLMLAWAYALMHLARQNRAALRLILLPMLGIGMASHFLGTPRFDWRAWLQPVQAQWQDGDLVYHPALSTAITLQYYLDGKPYLLRPYSSDLNQALSDSTRRAMGFTEGAFEEATAQARRVWILFYTNPMSSRAELEFLARMAREARLIQRRANELSTVAIYLYETPKAARHD